MKKPPAVPSIDPLFVEVQSASEHFALGLALLVVRAELRELDELIALLRQRQKPARPLPKPRVRRVDRIASLMDRAATLLKEANRGMHTSELRSRLELGPNEFKDVMSAMLDGGMVRRRGERRGTTYYAPGVRMAPEPSVANVTKLLRAHPRGMTSRELGVELGLSSQISRAWLREAMAAGFARREGIRKGARYFAI